MNSSHPPPDRIKAFGLGRLPGAEAAPIQEHVSACATCCQALATVADDKLVALLRPSPETAWWPGSFPSPLSQGLAPPPELTNHPRYRILQVLGEGGMGTVYKAEHRLMNRLVAIKVVRDRLFEKPAVRERFLRELRTAGRLAHPNIVAAHDAEQAGDCCFLVMEYVPGESLADVVKRRGPLPAAEACSYVRQAALGLQYAHQRGLVHRDIKPGNLMLTPEGVVKVLDFGLARFTLELAAEQTAADAILGTPAFMAPEQARNARGADIRADIFGLGGTLYYLLTGHPPTGGISAVADAGTVPANLVHMLNRMLAPNPGDRFQTPAEVVLALAPFAGAPPIGGSPSKIRSRRRLLVCSAGLATATALLIFLGNFFFWNGRTQPNAGPDEIYRWVPPLQVTGVSKNIEVYEKDNGVFTYTGLAKDGGLFLANKPGGGKLQMPDALGSTNIRVKVNHQLGYTTLAGLRFQDDATVNISNDGAVQVDRVGVRATGLRGPNQYVSKNVEGDGGGMIVMVLVKGPDAPVVGKNFAPKKAIEVRRWLGHTNKIAGIALVPARRRFLTGSFGELYLWDLDQKAEVWHSENFEVGGWMYGVALSADGSTALAGGQDRSVHLWDMAKRTRLGKLESGGSPVESLALAPDGQHFVFTTQAGVGRLCTVKPLKEIGRFLGNPVAFAGNGRTFVSANNRSLYIWDAQKPSSKELRRMDGPARVIGSLAVSADGSRAITGEPWNPDGQAHLWDLAGGKVVTPLTGHKVSSVTEKPFIPGGVYAVAISADGRLALTGDAAGVLRLWDATTGKMLHQWQGHHGPVSALALMPDGSQALSGGEDKILRLWSMV